MDRSSRAASCRIAAIVAATLVMCVALICGTTVAVHVYGKPKTLGDALTACAWESARGSAYCLRLAEKQK